MAIVVLAVIPAALVLGGCTAQQAPDPTPSPSVSESPSEVATPGLTEVQDDPGAGTDGAGGGFDGALADADLLSCERSGDAWAVTGTVTNPTDAVVDYRIYVSLLAPDTDTRALVQVDATAVEPAASQDWSVDIAVPEDDLECVLRVERYAV